MMDDGLLGADATVMGDAEMKAFYAAEGTPVPAKKQTRHLEPTELEGIAIVKTPAQQALTCADKVMKDISEARTFHMKLAGAPTPCADNVCASLDGYVKKQTELYHVLKAHCLVEKTTEQDVARALQLAEVRTKWYETYVKPVAQTLAAGIIKKPKKQRVGKNGAMHAGGC